MQQFDQVTPGVGFFDSFEDTDPFADDPGSTPEGEHRPMAQKGGQTDQKAGQTAPRLAEVAPRGDLPTPMADLEGKDLHLCAVDECETRYGPAFRLRCLDPYEGEEHIVITSGVALRDQLKQAQALLAQEGILYVLVRFVKEGRCWVIE